MSRKILVVATSDIHLQVFHLPYLKMLKDKGYEVNVAVEVRGNGKVPFADHLFNLPFKRTLFSFRLLEAYRRLEKIINEGDYALVHCHTPIPSAMTRLAAGKARKKGTVVLYTAHGFHFYKGAPLSYWLTYYLAEKYLSGKTDAIITINKEDYDLASKKFYANRTHYIKGIGVDTSKFRKIEPVSKENFKREMGYEPNSFILLYAANFIDRKNHQFVLRALGGLKDLIPEIKILFAGSGIRMQKMIDFTTEHGLHAYVDFLGFRKDMDRLLAIADVSISSSKQEGLGLALAEAMVCGVPVIASEDRGHKELIVHNETGFLFEQENEQAFIDSVFKLYQDRDLSKKFVKNGVQKIRQFSIENSLASMDKIYDMYLTEK
ncbi:glycosyltransferase family 1 protein [Pedobacter sp. HMWF019]|uniref:glycosyltransferase family 4 protein n=1 Tax=Pedobacter sp. HMWF019 TaxID=2056856 RepID=UPI000D3ACF29|nr:glycosyltransferase family 4 protein [Pedobacter sp. HMWF019]PTT04033.1 glycosyltransferase family 1 protein [Pedobacter sp. HMWF019]